MWFLAEHITNLCFDFYALGRKLFMSETSHDMSL